MDAERYYAAVKRYAELEVEAAAGFAAVRETSESVRFERSNLLELKQTIAKVRSGAPMRASALDRLHESRRMALLKLEEKESEIRLEVLQKAVEVHTEESQRRGRLRDQAKPLIDRARAEHTAIMGDAANE